ncbi:MAG: DNA processing protein [Glaciecola sp.]
MKSETISRLALSVIPRLGAVKAKELVTHYGSADTVFKMDEKQLLASNVNPNIAKNITDPTHRKLSFERAQKELDFIEKKRIELIHFDGDTYPSHLQNCIDSPFLLFKKGNTNLEARKTVAIVGTRNATSYGLGFTDLLVKHLAQHQVTVVSGLAYGIDGAAHKACLKYNTPTIGVLGHGLDMIYPTAHRKLAADMLENGSLLTEFMSETPSLPANFPKRNRIVAGMVDAVIVVEGAIKGGAMVTANLAHGYEKELFAVPGRSIDKYSQGCNYLIKTQRALFLDDPEELAMELGWEMFDLKKKFQKNDYNLDASLSETEKEVLKILLDKGGVSKENFCKTLKLSIGEISSILFELELKDKIISKPGNYFEIRML